MTPAGRWETDRPRVVIATYALDQHEAGAMVVAQMLRDAGAEVIYLGRFNLPEMIARTAVQEDADVIGISCHSWEYLGYTEELLEALRSLCLGDPIPVVLGGAVITTADAEALEAAGVAAVVGPGRSPTEIIEIVDRLAARRVDR